MILLATKKKKKSKHITKHKAESNKDQFDEKHPHLYKLFSFIKSIFSSNDYAITAHKLAFSYDKKEILSDFTLKIKKGQIIGIVGKSGSGKSTFLKLITGVISKSHKGNIQIFGKDKLLKKSNIGYVPQENAFIPELTLRENIILFGKLYGLSSKFALSKSKSLLRLMHLTEFEDHKPKNLSGGQKVRLNILISLLHNPKIIILDEPFVGLDFYNRKLLWLFFKSLQKEGRTLIMTTHLLSEIEKYADIIYVLKEGKIWVKGTPEHIKTELKSQAIIEVVVKGNINNEKILDIKEFCRKKTTKLIDIYEQTLIFNLEALSKKDQLSKFLNKIGLKHSVTTLKQANMDEALMGL